MNNLTTQAAQILELTKQMITAAQQSDMPRYNQLSTEREQLISLVEQLSFEAIPENEDTQTAREMLLETRALNDQLSQMMKQTEQKLLDSKSQIKKGQAMRKAYGENR